MDREITENLTQPQAQKIIDRILSYTFAGKKIFNFLDKDGNQ